VYELLLSDTAKLPPLCMCDLWEGDPGEGSPGDLQGNSRGGMSDERRRLLESYWQHARDQAAIIMATSGMGNMPAGLMRELDRLNPSTLPWRDYLWRYLVRTPTDFEEFDRRFLSQGLYLESLEGESVRVTVRVDTSGSVSADQMRQFLGEVLGILRAYPHIKCDFYYCDAKLYGPFDINAAADMPTPQGGGGTDFRPFFEAITPDEDGESLCVYLTDGFGYFPEEAPGYDVLWVVTPGGLDLARFPFGETVRLLQD
jgi:predicted metal-dependent peptidase